jgi:hypothetical protein
VTRTTRRSLIRAGALAAALAPFLAIPEVYAAATTRRDLYSRTRFSALRRKSFRLDAPGRHWRLKLIKVSNLANCKKQDSHAFSLTFRAGSAGPEQGSYVLQRPGFKATTLFLVPSDRDRRTYQAVIFRKP